MFKLLLPVLFMLLAPPGFAIRQDGGWPSVADCALPEGVRSIRTLSALPAGVRPYFEQRIGVLADVGASFNRTDSIGSDSPPQRRFLGAAMKERVLVVWYERGGRALTVHAVGFVVNPTPRPGRSAIALLPNAHFTGNLCAAARALMDGARTQPDSNW